MKQFVKSRPIPELPDMKIVVSTATRNFYVYRKSDGALCAAINNDIGVRPATGGELRWLRFERRQIRLRINERWGNDGPITDPEILKRLYLTGKFLDYILQHADYYGVLGQ